MSGSGKAGFPLTDSSGTKGGYLTRALIGGLAAGIPVAWLLEFLSVLPYFLGLFFVVVLGLLIGAVMYRLGRPAAPVARDRLTPISLIVALGTWATVLVVEYRSFPDYAAKQLEKKSLTSHMTDSELEAYHESVRQAARDYLSKQAWPGGLPGYLRWAATSGRMMLPRAGGSPPYELSNVQAHSIWAIRVTVSLVLLIFAIDSQFSSLAPRRVKGEGNEPAGDSEPK